MWTRVEIKTRAKAVLRNNFWRAFLVSLVLLVAGAGYSSTGSGSSRGSNNSKNNYHSVSGYANQYVNNAINSISPITVYESNDVLSHNTTEVIGTYIYSSGMGRNYSVNPSRFMPFAWLPSIFWMIFGFGLAIIGFGTFLFRILAGYGLEVGGRRYFINATDNPKTDFKVLKMAFKSPNYFNVLSIMFLRSLKTFLWSLLFAIPGIVKSFEYSMIPYILADNPTISSQRAFELSREMTNGHKWDMFVLNLSFLGWYILGSLCFGIGVLFVYPYENATKAELYIKLRDNAINAGIVNCEELCLYPVYDYIDTTSPVDEPNHN